MRRGGGLEERLTAVELERLGVLLSDLVGGVGCGILDAAFLAGLAGQGAVEGVDEEAGCSREEDISGLVRWSMSVEV